ncbi:MAG TPA: TorF family putative porin [Steroidobacteraceae bacterium]
MDAGGSDRCDLARFRLNVAAFSAAMLFAAPRCLGADTWGGSLDLTSDYFVRGISRSDNRPALQLDLHYLDASGFLADLFASSTQIDPQAKRDAELSAFLGYVWSGSGDWQGKILVGNYSYPWNADGSRYNYDEVDVELAYREWLRAVLAYSPDTRRYLYDRGLVRGQAESAELDAQRSVVGKLSATAGIGFYQLDGAGAAGYGYWSVGAAYDLAPVALTLSYVGTTRQASGLFYTPAGNGRWSGTIIWRF